MGEGGRGAPRHLHYRPQVGGDVAKNRCKCGVGRGEGMPPPRVASHGSQAPHPYRLIPRCGGGGEGIELFLAPPPPPPGILEPLRLCGLSLDPERGADAAAGTHGG